MTAPGAPTRKFYVSVCLPFIGAAYYLMLFTHWGNRFHGPGPWSAMAMDGFIVLAAYSTLELFRFRRGSGYWILGLPFVAAAIFRIYWAISHYYWQWLFA